MQSYLEFDGVTKHYADFPVVEQPFSLSVTRGQLLVFLGPSGCGKTTLMRMVGGLDEPTSGRITLEGKEISRPGRDRGMVFQSYSSFPWLTVEGNVRFGMQYRRDLSKAERNERAKHYIGLVGLTGFEQSFPNRVSGGMRQRLAIARTLAAGSDVLLMDEPFGALDALRRETLQSELRSIQRAESKTIIFVTHDIDEAAYIADRVIVFSKRPAAISADVDVASVLGEERPAEIRDKQEFIALRRELGLSIRSAAAEEA